MTSNRISELTKQKSNEIIVVFPLILARCALLVRFGWHLTWHLTPEEIYNMRSDMKDDIWSDMTSDVTSVIRFFYAIWHEMWHDNTKAKWLGCGVLLGLPFSCFSLFFSFLHKINFDIWQGIKYYLNLPWQLLWHLINKILIFK